VLAGFQQTHPNVSLDVVVIDRERNPVQRASTSCGHAAGELRRCARRGLCPLDRFVVAARNMWRSNGYPQHPADLSEARLLNFGPTDQSGLSRPLRSDRCDRGTAPDHERRPLLLESAAGRIGIAIISSYMASAALERGQLVRLLDAFPVPQFWIRAQIPHSRSHLSRVQALC